MVGTRRFSFDPIQPLDHRDGRDRFLDAPQMMPLWIAQDPHQAPATVDFACPFVSSPYLSVFKSSAV